MRRWQVKIDKIIEVGLKEWNRKRDKGRRSGRGECGERETYREV
jgi:hypothetical protein